MTRDEAIDILIQQEAARLAVKARYALLLDWWSLDEGDPEYGQLPEPLRAALASSDEPTDPENNFYDPLIRIALKYSFVGVTNAYLEQRLKTLGRITRVEGIAERLVECPCCGYESLSERGIYEVCRVCFWEDDGMKDLDTVSGPNHMTLREARRNFQVLGAVSEAARVHVLPDGQSRYVAGVNVIRNR
jgi:hypothetical protein